jgi:pimeloyl-ACP methyl ester carboxylesterase
VTPMLAYARFGRWRDALTEPRPPDNQPYAIGIWHYSRALAFVGRRDVERAAAELARLKVVMDHDAFKTTLKELPLLTNLEIASRMAQGELAARRGRIEEAVRVLKEAVALDDAFPYNEPPVWHHPPRQVLGAVLLEAGQPREAEAVYREDLEQFRENGWSLFGLGRSLEAQGRRADAVATEQRFSKAWSRSDIVLRSSRIMEDDRMSVASFPAVDLRAGFSRKDITLSSGITLEYMRRGDPSGVPVIFLHGATDSWRVWKEVFAGIVQFDVSRELSKIEVPTLVLWGGKETIATFKEQEALVRGLTRARIRVYEDAGHAIHWDEPARVAHDIATFVGEVARAEAPALHTHR